VLFKNRKAVSERVYFTIFELLMIGIIYLVLISFVHSIANNHLLEKNYYIRDMAMTINTVYGAPGDIEVPYTLELLNNQGIDLIFLIGNGQVLVREQDTYDLAYPYFKDHTADFKNPKAGFSTQNKLIYFLKKDKKVSVMIDPTLLQTNQYPYPAINTNSDITKTGVVTTYLFVSEGFDNDMAPFAAAIKKANEKDAATKFIYIGLLYDKITETEVEKAREHIEKNRKEIQEKIKQMNPAPGIIINIEEYYDNDIGISKIEAEFNQNTNDAVRMKSQKLATQIINQFKKNPEMQPWTMEYPSASDDPEFLSDKIQVKIKMYVAPGDYATFNKEENRDKFTELIVDGIKEYHGINTAQFSGTKFNRMPVDQTPIQLNSCFGKRNQGDGWHDGIDINVAVGTPVKSVAAGIVYRKGAGYNDGYGGSIVIKHNDNLFTRYSHLSQLQVDDVGQSVSEGQIIGLSGGKKGAVNAGSSEGPHLDFKVYKTSDIGGDKGDNPFCYLPFDAVGKTFTSIATSCSTVTAKSTC